MSTSAEFIVKYICPDNSSRGGVIMAKHLTYDDRLEIEKYLKLNFSLSEISRELNRHKSTNIKGNIY